MTAYGNPYQYGQRLQHLNTLKLNFEQYRFISRALDLSVCIFLLPFLLLPAVLICLAIILDSRGSPLFIQTRIGFNGRSFKIFKFRTMTNDLNDKKHRAFMKSFVAGEISNDTEDEDRIAKYKPIQRSDITRIGRLLRKTSLDELPQLVNVIRGEMSLIGPRPNVPWEVESYKSWHRERLNALPGITGLAQVMGRSEIIFDDIVRHDIQYVKYQSVHLDLWIIWRTLSAILSGDGAG